QVLGLQVSELLLLRAQLEVEEVIVQLRHDCLERNTVLDARGAHHRSYDATGIDKARGARGGNGCLFEVPRRMSGRRHLLDALPEDAVAPDDVGDLRLVERHLDRTGP